MLDLILYVVVGAAGVALGLYLHHTFFNEKMRRELDDTKREVGTAEEEVARLQKKLKAAKRAAKPPRIDADEEEVGRLRGCIEDLEEQCDALARAQLESEERIERLLADNEVLRCSPPPVSEEPRAAPLPNIDDGDGTEAKAEAQVDAEDAAKAEAEAQRLREDLQQRDKRLTLRAQELRNAQRQLKRLTADVSKRENEASEYELRIEQLVKTLDQRDAEIDTHVSRLARINSSAGQLKKLRTDFAALQQAHSGCDGSLADLRNELKVAQIAPAAVELESGPSEEPRAWLLNAPQDGQPDDLKKIRGIGPVLEGLLNEMGIFHFWQIAQLSSNDAAHVASHIKTFPDRIRRDGWVKQASELAKGSGAAKT